MDKSNIEYAKIKKINFEEVDKKNITDNIKYAYEYYSYRDNEGNYLKSNKIRYFQTYYNGDPVNYLVRSVSEVEPQTKEIKEKFMLNEQLTNLFNQPIDEPFVLKMVDNINIYNEAVKKGNTEEINNQLYFGELKKKKYFEELQSFFSELKENDINICQFNEVALVDKNGNATYPSFNYEEINMKLESLINSIYLEKERVDK